MDTIKLINCIDFAAKKHVAQRRKNKNKDPYINHPIDLANTLVNCGITDLDILCAAILHDTIEDTNTTKNELLENFGEVITSLVMECSDDKSLDKITRKKLQISHAKTTSDKAKLVKLADKYSNIKSLSIDPPMSWNPNVIRGYMVWANACCLNLYGVTSIDGADKLDELLKQFFITNKITLDDLDQQLENYYTELSK